tara:strand:- start:160 stop:384 length:225 start_codon:yes stop_codon:yes gene_type:complete
MHLYHKPSGATFHAYTKADQFGFYVAIVTKRIGNVQSLKSRVKYPSRYLAKKAAARACKALFLIHSAQSTPVTT